MHTNKVRECRPYQEQTMGNSYNNTKSKEWNPKPQTRSIRRNINPYPYCRYSRLYQAMMVAWITCLVTSIKRIIKHHVSKPAGSSGLEDPQFQLVMNCPSTRTDQPALSIRQRHKNQWILDIWLANIGYHLPWFTTACGVLSICINGRFPGEREPTAGAGATICDH